MLFCFHVGAHETASAYIQSALDDEREAIQRRKLRVLTHGWTRPAVTQRLDDAAANDDDAERKLAKTFATMVKLHAVRDRLVASDENLAGPICGPSGLYPDAAKRLATLRSAKPDGHEFEATVCVRDYAGFFDSLSTRRADRSEPHDVRAIRDAALNLQRGWTEVVADICDVFGADRTTVWTYDAFLHDPERIARAMLGDTAPRVFAEFDRASFSPLTRKAVAVLERASDLLGADDYDRLEGALRRFNFEPPDGIFSVFDPAEADLLAARYAEDLKRIAKLGCRLIQGGIDRPERTPAIPAGSTV